MMDMNMQESQLYLVLSITLWKAVLRMKKPLSMGVESIS
jgi:hypothetical protein